MKKFLILCFSFIFIVSLAFGAWKNSDDYKAYKDAKKAALEAENAGDTFNAIANYKKAAEFAAKSATKEIQAWQLNNAAFFLIKQFKLFTGYEEKIQKLSEMKSGKDKIKYQSKIAELFNMHTDLLKEAKELLDEALSLVSKESEDVESNTQTVRTEKGPKQAIESNLKYIDWVENFIKDNLKEEQIKKQEEKK